jgi:hydrogenase-4 component F
VSIFIITLCVIFAGFANHVMKICFGESNTSVRIHRKPSMIVPQYVLLATSLVLCFWIPEPFFETIMNAVKTVGGGF